MRDAGTFSNSLRSEASIEKPYSFRSSCISGSFRKTEHNGDDESEYCAEKGFR